MSLDLKPEVESQLQAYAQAEGTTASEYIARLLKGQGALHKVSSSSAAVAQDRPSALGKYAHVPGGSVEFAREKQAEIDCEDRER